MGGSARHTGCMRGEASYQGRMGSHGVAWGHMGSHGPETTRLLFGISISIAMTFTSP